MNSPETFRYFGRDALSQFAVFFLVFGAGCLPFPILISVEFGIYVALAFLAVSFLLAFGLRFSIDVSPRGVVITRSWFGIPYRRHRGRVIDDVFFGGDWGEAEGACGVVVEMDGREFHIGTSRSMLDLHAALLQFASGRDKRVPGDSA